MKDLIGECRREAHWHLKECVIGADYVTGLTKGGRKVSIKQIGRFVGAEVGDLFEVVADLRGMDAFFISLRYL